MIASIPILIDNTDTETVITGTPKRSQATFYFDPGLFAGYWIDTVDNSIVFYISNLCFRTPYKVSTIAMFNNYMSNRGIILS